jgi:H+/Cl- antiporter ClcA
VAWAATKTPKKCVVSDVREGHLHPAAFYLAIIAQFAAFAVPAVLAWRKWEKRKAILLGWAIIVIVAQALGVLAFFYPRVFGLTSDEVHIPDAPDVLPTALVALLVSAVSFGIGTVARVVLRRE